MANNPENSLNKNHKQHLRATCQEVDRLLIEIETFLSISDFKSPFPPYSNDLTPVQKQVARDYSARIRAQIVRVLESQSIPLPPPTCGISKAIAANLIGVDIAVEELKPKYMSGYGAIPEEAIADLNGLVGELQGLVEKFRLYLVQGAGQDLQERLARLEQTGGAIELLKRLEACIAKHGLVEFRSSLSMILERLEDQQLEIALFGRVSSGKSSLLNYLLQTKLLPVGVNPVTAFPTRIRYGAVPKLTVWFASQNTQQFPIEQLVEFASERHNPANIKQVTRIGIEFPSPRLQEGFVFVDTPGLGSLASAGAAETIAYLPRCDLGIVLIDAGATLTQEDLATIQTLYEAAIPALVLLSKVDALNPTDWEQSLHYIADKLHSQLGFSLPVYPVSVVGEQAGLVEQWFEQELRPLCDRHQQLAEQSIRRKIGALRESVMAALAMKLEQSEQRPQRQVISLKDVETALRRTTGRFEETRLMCETLTDDRVNLSERTLEQAATEIIARWATPTAQAINVDDIVHSVMLQVSANQAQKIYQVLRELAQAMATALNQTAMALEQNHVPSDAEFFDCLQEMPRFELGRLDLNLQPPFWLALSQSFATQNVKSKLQQQVGGVISDAFRAYQRLLKPWVRQTLTTLQTHFDNYADIYRAQLERLTTVSDDSLQHHDSIQSDLDSLSHWQVSTDQEGTDFIEETVNQ
jgi:GTP-binding protein EngB required for normal cell division